MPVTSCECERSFSALRMLKTYTRSTMVAERLNGLALFHVLKDIIVNIDKVIDLYAMKNQRLKFYFISILINCSLNVFINKDTDTYTQHPVWNCS